MSTDLYGFGIERLMSLYLYANARNICRFVNDIDLLTGEQDTDIISKYYWAVKAKINAYAILTAQ